MVVVVVDVIYLFNSILGFDPDQTVVVLVVIVVEPGLPGLVWFGFLFFAVSFTTTIIYTLFACFYEDQTSLVSNHRDNQEES